MSDFFVLMFSYKKKVFYRKKVKIKMSYTYVGYIKTLISDQKIKHNKK